MRLSRREFLGGLAITGAASVTIGAFMVSSKDRSTLDTDTLPSVDDLSGEWMAATDLLHPPSVTNFWGGLQCTSNVLSFDSLSFPPFSQGGETCRLQVDGQDVITQESRWYPYQVLRRASLGAIQVDTVTAMECEARTVLLKLTLANASHQNKNADLSVELSPRIRRFDGAWQWAVPRPAANDISFSAQLDSSLKVCSVFDTESSTVACFGFFGPAPDLLTSGATATATWRINLRPGQKFTVGIVMAVSADEAGATNAVVAHAAHLPQSMATTKEAWQRRWTDAFTPGNRHFSGHLPVLETADVELRRVYYMSVMALLQLERTNFSTFPRVFVTTGPESGVTLTYFWDTSLAASILAMLDPAILRKQLEHWLTVDIHDGYAIDMLSGHLVGPWYAANAFSVVSTTITYLDYSGDLAFLDYALAGEAVLDRLIRLVDDWHDLLVPATGLADFGGIANLLEEVPNYVNQVPSLNAAAVWMLRETARLCRYASRDDDSSRLTDDAARLVSRVLGLYLDRAGYWQSVHDNGTAVPVRHVYDFDTIGRHLSSDLAPRTTQEMREFVWRELAQDGWLRALSQQDPDAAESLRPDHGSTGAYDAWAALAASSMARLGDPDGALTMLRGFAQVTQEAPFSQSHQFVAPTDSAVQRDFRVRISTQNFNACNGGAFAATIIEDIFGYHPLAGRPAVNHQRSPRGLQGRLLGVPVGGTTGHVIDVQPRAGA